MAVAYAVQSAQKINSLTRRHSTHAYGFSHAHAPISHARKPGVDLGDYSRPSPGCTLGEEFIPPISMLFWVSFELVFPFFWSAEGWCGLLKHRDPINPDRAGLGSCPSLGGLQ